jgi:hypothetical protein
VPDGQEGPAGKAWTGHDELVLHIMEHNLLNNMVFSSLETWGWTTKRKFLFTDEGQILTTEMWIVEAAVADPPRPSIYA